MATSNVLFARPFVTPFTPVSGRRNSTLSNSKDSSYTSSSGNDTDFETFVKSSQPGPDAFQPSNTRNCTRTHPDQLVIVGTAAGNRRNSSQRCDSLDFGLPWRGRGASSSSSRESSVSSRVSSLRDIVPLSQVGTNHRTAMHRLIPSNLEGTEAPIETNYSSHQDSRDGLQTHRSALAVDHEADLVQIFLEEQRRVRHRLTEMTDNHKSITKSKIEPIPAMVERLTERQIMKKASEESLLSSDKHGNHSRRTSIVEEKKDGEVRRLGGLRMSSAERKQDTMFGSSFHQHGPEMVTYSRDGTPDRTHMKPKKESCDELVSDGQDSTFPLTELKIPRQQLIESDATLPLGNATYEKSVEILNGVERQVLRRVTRIQRSLQSDRGHLCRAFNKASPLASPAGPNRLLSRSVQQNLETSTSDSQIKPLHTDLSTTRNESIDKRVLAEMPSSTVSEIGVDCNADSKKDFMEVDNKRKNHPSSKGTPPILKLPGLVKKVGSQKGISQTARPHVHPTPMLLRKFSDRESLKSTGRMARETIQQYKELEQTQRELASRQGKLEKFQQGVEARQLQSLGKEQRKAKDRKLPQALSNKSTVDLISTAIPSIRESIEGSPTMPTTRKKCKNSLNPSVSPPGSATVIKRRGVGPLPAPSSRETQLKMFGQASDIRVSELRRMRSSEARAVLRHEQVLQSGCDPDCNHQARAFSINKHAAVRGNHFCEDPKERSKSILSLPPSSHQNFLSEDFARKGGAYCLLSSSQQTASPSLALRVPESDAATHVEASVLRELCLQKIPPQTILPHHEIKFVVLRDLSSPNTETEKCISMPAASPGDLQRMGIGLQKINSGTFCTVYKAFWRGIEVAVKCPDESLLKTDGAMMRYRALQEWRILSRTNHPYVLNFHGGVVLRDQLWLVADYIKGGDLYSLLYHRPPEYLRPEVRLSLMEQLCEAVAYLHTMQPRIAHKDLKCNNLLCTQVGNDLRLSVCDFGDAEEMTGKYLQFCTAATWQYTPPELIGTEDPARPQKATEKVDMWAVGCVFLEILRCATPFVHILDSVVDSRQRETLRQCYLQNRLEKECRIPASLPPGLRTLVKACLSFEAHSRPCARELLQVIKNSKGTLLREIVGWQSRWETAEDTIQELGNLKTSDGTLRKLNEELGQNKTGDSRYFSVESNFNRMMTGVAQTRAERSKTRTRKCPSILGENQGFGTRQMTLDRVPIGASPEKGSRALQQQNAVTYKEEGWTGLSNHQNSYNKNMQFQFTSGRHGASLRQSLGGCNGSIRAMDVLEMDTPTTFQSSFSGATSEWPAPLLVSAPTGGLSGLHFGLPQLGKTPVTTTDYSMSQVPHLSSQKFRPQSSLDENSFPTSASSHPYDSNKTILLTTRRTPPAYAAQATPFNSDCNLVPPSLALACNPSPFLTSNVPDTFSMYRHAPASRRHPFSSFHTDRGIQMPSSIRPTFVPSGATDHTFSLSHNSAIVLDSCESRCMRSPTTPPLTRIGRMGLENDWPAHRNPVHSNIAHDFGWQEPSLHTLSTQMHSLKSYLDVSAARNKRPAVYPPSY